MKNIDENISVKENSGFNELNIFEGKWNAEAIHPLIENLIKGKITFDWIEGNSFLLMKSDWQISTVPDSRSIIGYDKSSNAYVMFYSDERKVLRIYEMTFNVGIWKLWRNSPGFHKDSQVLSKTVTINFPEHGNFVKMI